LAATRAGAPNLTWQSQRRFLRIRLRVVLQPAISQLVSPQSSTCDSSLLHLITFSPARRWRTAQKSSTSSLRKGLSGISSMMTGLSGTGVSMPWLKVMDGAQGGQPGLCADMGWLVSLPGSTPVHSRQPGDCGAQGAERPNSEAGIMRPRSMAARGNTPLSGAAPRT
jgi:hypothetical protein